MSDAPASLIPAATVVCIRDGAESLEALLLRRNNALRAFAGAWVFPGGKVDAADGAEGADEIECARSAAVREANEEAGLTLHPDDLVLFSLWIPPEQEKRRFKTWFFLAKIDAQTVIIDEGEIHEHRWVRPKDVIINAPNPELPVLPPTFMTLQELSAAENADAAMSNTLNRDPPRFETRLQKRGDHRVVYWEGDAAYETGELDAPGPRLRMILAETSWRFEGGI